MAHLIYKQTTTLTMAVVNVVLPVTDPYDVYEVVTSGPTAILGTSTFTSSGTLVEGVSFKFRYKANVTSGNVSFMGVTLPSHLRNKDCYVDCYYNGSSWDVAFVPNFGINDVLTVNNLVDNPGSHVIATASPSLYTSANVAGVQTLASVVIPPNTLGGAALNEAFRITAWGSFSNADPKNLELNVVTGAFTHILFKNNVTTINNRFKVEAIVTATPPGVFQSEAIIVAGNANSTGWVNSGVNWDYTVNQTVNFTVEEVTPTGGLVILRQLRVEKITL